MRNSLGWIVFTRLDQNSIYRDMELCQEEKFETYEQADAFLEVSHRPGGAPRKYNCWMGPIPIVSLSTTGEVPFAGPRLEERLRFSDTDKEGSFHELFGNFWQDDAVDQIPRVMNELEQNGEIPGALSSDLWSPPILTPTHHKKVQRRLRDLRLPDIECYLNEMWRFPVIEINARRRLGHINPDVSIGFGNRLLSAALDLQAAFCGVHPRHTAADTFWFWTSLQVHTHLAEFCKKHLWDQGKYNDSLVESARRHFSRALGSYAYEAWPSGGAAHTLKSSIDIASNCNTAAKEDLVPNQESPGARPSIDDLVAHSEARFMKWHQKLRQNRDDRLRELHRLNLGAAGRAVRRFTIYDELLTREVKQRIKIRKAVADKYGAVELLSKAQLDVFREVIMTSVAWACLALKDHNEMDFRAVGERGPFPDTNRYEGLKARILSVVNTELEVLETEGRLLALSVETARAPTADVSAGQGQAREQGDQTYESGGPSLASPEDARRSSGELRVGLRPKRRNGPIPPAQSRAQAGDRDDTSDTTNSDLSTQPTQPESGTETSRASMAVPKQEDTKHRSGKERKGDATLLGQKRLVNFGTAQQYLGISERQRQKLINNGALKVEGQGQNRKITAESLKAYLPLEIPN